MKRFAFSEFEITQRFLPAAAPSASRLSSCTPSMDGCLIQSYIHFFFSLFYTVGKEQKVQDLGINPEPRVKLVAQKDTSGTDPNAIRITRNEDLVVRKLPYS